MNIRNQTGIVIIPPTMNGKISKYHPRRFALEHGFQVLIIEDGSPDGTAAIVKTYNRNFPTACLWWNAKKLG